MSTNGFTQWEAEAFQSAIDAIADSAEGRSGRNLSAVRAYLNGKPVVVVALSHPDGNPDHIIPMAVLLLGDVIDEITVDNDAVAKVNKNPDYTPDPERVSV